ncbi:MAG: CPBP family intramembrane glutamic endopeptidase [Pseudomonadota bacterium]
MSQTLLLLLILAGLAGLSYFDKRAYGAFRLVEDSARRRAFYWGWTWIPFIAFGVGGLGLLASIGSLDALYRLPAEFAVLRPAIAPPATVDTSSDGYLLGVVIGAGLALAIAISLWALRIRKMILPVVGDIEPLLPRNNAEIAQAIPMAINAGLSEELYFRLALPLLATHVTGSALAGFAIACAAFALVHWYQGWKGMLAVFAVGVWLSWLYLATGSLLKPILVHILIDLVALVVRPAIALHFRRRAAAA